MYLHTVCTFASVGVFGDFSTCEHAKPDDQVGRQLRPLTRRYHQPRFRSIGIIAMQKSLLTATLVSCGLFLGGCGTSAPAPSSDQASEAHDHHDEHGDHGHDHGHDHDHDHGHAHAAPESLSAAVSTLAGLRDKIDAALSEADLETADGPVHEVGHILESLPALADKAAVNAEQSETVKQAQAALFEAFGALDKTIHGKSSGKSWDDVKETVNSAIADLQNVTSATNDKGDTQ